MKKLKIHVINKYFYPVKSGIETNLIEVYNRLAQKGYEITVHTSRNTLEEKNTLPKTGTIKGIKIVRYDYKTFGFFPKIPLDVNIVSLHNFTIFPNFVVLVWVLLLKLLHKKNFTFIFSPQSGFNPDWGSMPTRKALPKMILHRTSGAMLINFTADGVRAISKWEYDELIKSGIRKDLIDLIGNGTQREAFQNNEKLVDKTFKNKVVSLKPFIVQIGRIHPIKNYETAIKALKRLPKNIKFVIIGSVENQEYMQRLKSQITDLNLDKRVVFLNSLSEAQKYFVLKNAEVMVHMAWHEGYCNAVHEGMSQGLVCVVSNRTALPALVKNGVNGYCIEPDDYEGVYKKIDFIIKNKNTREVQQMKRNNLHFTSQTTWSHVADKIESFYLTIAKENHPQIPAKKKFALTIGIPAFNEEANIKKLLQSILKQKKDNFFLKKIIVISDGSTDKTVEEARSVKNKIIKVLDSKKREGLNKAQNRLIGLSSSEILVILNADILPDNEYFLSNLIQPFFYEPEIGIVGARTKSIKTSKFIGKILASSHEIKESLFQKLNNANNVYLCHGQARAFSKQFYKNFHWPESYPEDAYSYIACIKQGYKFVYAKKAVVNFSPSTNIKDYAKQNSRFYDGVKILKQVFEPDIVKSHYRIPLLMSSFYLFNYFARKPVMIMGFILLYIISRLLLKTRNIDHSKFEIALSSKKLNI